MAGVIAAECVWWFVICVGIQAIPTFGLLEAKPEPPDEGGNGSRGEERARDVRPATR
jgi:hypothetical protein